MNDSILSKCQALFSCKSNSNKWEGNNDNDHNNDRNNKNDNKNTNKQLTVDVDCV